MTFTTPNSNLIQIKVSQLSILNYQNIQVSATLSINGYGSLSTSTPATISNMYAEPVSNYGVTLSSQILGLSSIATLSITLSSFSLLQMSYIIVYIPQ